MLITKIWLQFQKTNKSIFYSITIIICYGFTDGKKINFLF